MGRGTSNLFTLWTPFGDTSVEMGTLAVLEGSNKLPSFKKLQQTYASMDAEEQNLMGTGWFTEDPLELSSQFGGTWKTSDYNAGDVLIFGMRTFHMSTVNTTRLVRISCDTRWQPASQPVDPRFIGDQTTGHGLAGESKFGVYAQELEKGGEKKDKKGVSIQELKKLWGFQH